MDLRARVPPVLSLPELVRAVRAPGRRIITFGGYGELGYEDEAGVLAIARAELQGCDPAHTLVATGTLITRGFQPGIALVYGLAREMGLPTLGIHPSVALREPGRHLLADGVDRACFVDDPTWGGCDAQGRPSATLQALLAVTDLFVAIGGGEHTAQELRCFRRAGKAVHFHPARMHRPTMERWTRAQGLPARDLDGAAARAWRDERGLA
jgi:hypothetical protein